MTFVRIVNERILAEEHANERINIVSAKSILKAAEEGDLEYLTKAVNTVELRNIEDTMTMMTQADKKGRGGPRGARGGGPRGGRGRGRGGPRGRGRGNPRAGPR